MNSLWSSRAANDGAESAAATEAAAQARAEVEATVGVADVGPAPGPPSDGAAPKQNPNPPSARPPLQRNQMQTNPPTQPAPPPGNQPGQPPDSLSLAQLRRIVSEIRGTEAVAYDFVYSDTAPHAEEIDEWFVYQFWQWVRLNAAQRAFEWQWELLAGAKATQVSWDEASTELRAQFVQEALDNVKSTEAPVRANAIGRLAYLILGRWADTAGQDPPRFDKSKVRSVATQSQLDAMKSGVKLLSELDGIPIIWKALRDSYDALRYVESQMKRSCSPLMQMIGWMSPLGHKMSPSRRFRTYLLT